VVCCQVREVEDAEERKAVCASRQQEILDPTEEQVKVL